MFETFEAAQQCVAIGARADAAVCGADATANPLIFGCSPLVQTCTITGGSAPAGCELEIPREHEQRAAYVVEGAVGCGGGRAESGRMLVFQSGADIRVRAVTDARVVLLGGAAIDGARHMFWNFVSSSKERIEQAKLDWRDGRFPKVPGDEAEFVPLPE